MSGEYLGVYSTCGNRTHVRFHFTTNNSSGGAVSPSSAFEPADFHIYRAADNSGFSITKRASSNGVNVSSPFTGLHSVDIDLTDNSDPGFYANGYMYSVVLSPDTETVDGQTVVSVLKCFEIKSCQPVVQVVCC